MECKRDFKGPEISHLIAAIGLDPERGPGRRYLGTVFLHTYSGDGGGFFSVSSAKRKVAIDSYNTPRTVGGVSRMHRRIVIEAAALGLLSKRDGV